MSGLVRARGLKPGFQINEKLRYVRARKSPWIETLNMLHQQKIDVVRARKSPWIETTVV